ncbi:MAG: flagellar FlbD family protein [Oscillospiraceae bacterium]|nr:flagellar FlbD family protein [Oscillospiraceae bacterium]
MIKVSKLNKEEFYINPSLIETVEKTPDTVITLINNKKYIISDSVEQVLNRIKEYYREVGMIPPQIVYKSYDFDRDEHEKKQK